MPWPNWKQAGVATVVLLLVGLVSRRSGRPRLGRMALAAEETALVSFLYMIWRLARQLPLLHEAGAEDRGRQIFRFEQWLHLPSELAISRWTLDHRWFAEINSAFYATAHVPVLIGFLIWLYVRHRPHYGRWRNALVITTGFCLFIRFIRVAPPRLLPDLGFVDVSAALQKSVYGAAGTGVSDQFAAMPSIHIAWATVVAFGAWEASSSRWRWLGVAHLAATFSAVVTTANHWWMDGFVAMALIGISLVLDDLGRRVVAAMRRPDEAGPEAAPNAAEPRPAPAVARSAGAAVPAAGGRE